MLWDHRSIRGILGRLYRHSLNLNHKVFFQNPDDREDFVRYRIFDKAEDSVFINGSGVNVERFKNMSYPDNISFLLTARLIKPKGVMEYLQAAKSLKSKYPNVRFSLVGWFDNKSDGLDRESLQEYIDQNIVEYLGKLDDVRPALAECSVFVLPSYREGTPKSVLEAMACGRAIITTDAPGCRETIDRNGYLIPVRDPVALSEAMEKFILEPELVEEMGRQSRQLAEDKFSVDKVNNVILNTMGIANV